MSAITLNNFMLWSDIVEEEERNERENICNLENAIKDGFVEVRRKEKKKKMEEEILVEETPKIKGKFCMSVLNKTECKFADNCIHAHSLKELTLTTCTYGKNCNKVKNGKNVDEANICLFVHPNEQGKENLGKYLRRLGVEIKTEKPRPVEVKSAPVEVKSAPVEVKSAPVEVKTVPVEVKPVPVEVKPVPVEVKTVPVEVKTVPVEVKTAPVEVKTAPELETKMFLDLTTNVVYVYVHHSNAKEVLRKLFDSGKTNIQLNVY
jgi:hypothetical protein